MTSRRKPSRLQSSVVVILVLGLVALAVQAIFGPRGHLEMERVEQDNQALRRQIEDYEAKNRRMMEEIESLKTDPAYIEKIAREELGLMREGDIKIVTKPSP